MELESYSTKQCLEKRGIVLSHRTKIKNMIIVMMRSLALVVVLSHLISPGIWAQVCPSIPAFETLNGEMITAVDLARGRWSLGFIVIPGCLTCEEVVKWFGQANRAFPEIHFLLVTPEDTAELRGIVQNHAPEVRVLLDSEHLLATALEVERLPTVFLSVEGVYITRLNWPFSKQEFTQAITESLSIVLEHPDPKELLGQPAPVFSSVDLEGNEIDLTDLPRPLLLSFFAPRCPSCWEILPTLTELAGEVAIGVVVRVREPMLSLSETQREQLEQFLRIVKEQGAQAAVILDRWTEEEGFMIGRAYKVMVVPTYILIDGKGVVTWVWEGCIEEQDLRNALSGALEGVD
ncbi:MAG: TlpA family protein disulfide reductase [Candidatus Bipolaricaulia bacterium]